MLRNAQGRTSRVGTLMSAVLVAALALPSPALARPQTSSSQTSTSTSTSATTPTTDGVATFTLNLAPQATSIGASLVTQDARNSIGAWFEVWARSRMVEVDQDLERPRVARGPWTAVSDIGATSAREDGSLTEWAEHYYITHDWSDIGQEILTLATGDTFCVNGVTVYVDGIFNYPKASYLNEVLTVVGEGAYILQTCLPNATYNRIVFGHALA